MWQKELRRLEDRCFQELILIIGIKTSYLFNYSRFLPCHHHHCDCAFSVHPRKLADFQLVFCEAAFLCPPNLVDLLLARQPNQKKL